MKKWNTKYHGIGLKFEPGVVRVRNDEILRFFLTKRKAPYGRLATVIKKAYRLKYGVDLDITVESLATEIWAHYRIKRICVLLEGSKCPLFTSPVFRRFLDKMMEHMAVIDMGEKKYDNNRWVWNLLEKVLPISCMK